MHAIKSVLIACTILVSTVLSSTIVYAENISYGTVLAADGINISYEHVKRGGDSVIIICPGFYNSKNNRWMRKACEIIPRQYDVIIFDFRGHGKSGGKFTWGSRETMDMAAIMNYASSGGYSHIGILAFSLGAAAAINSASGRNDIDSMILVSCPSSFEAIDYHFWEPEMLSDLKDNMECKWEGKGVRSGNPFLAKDKPVNSVKSLKNIPILFIHGDNDWVVKERHSKKLYEAANTYKRIEIVKGGLHAERLIQLHTEMMARLISEWFSETMGKERKLQ